MRAELPKIHEKGAELVIVGNGSPAMAQAFVEDLKIDSPLYTDPSLETYRALGFKHGAGTTFRVSSAVNAFRAIRGGFRQKGVQGAPHQQGGVLVVKRGGEIVYAYASDEAGDHPPVEDVLAALAKV